ncbi:MAG: hypothetical protein KAX65_00935 [Caldilineaceae bacterium]|nr:hypothetical protein [Caldilineaceae bacterium]
MIPPIAIRYLPHAMAVLAALGAATWVYSGIWDRGYDSCKAKWDKATAEAMIARDAELDVARLRGEALSAGLAAKERELSTLNREYLTYANAITGHCPESLGVLVGAAAAGQTLPAAPGPSPDPAATVGAAAIAANIATNYPRCWECIARLNALLDWHAGAKGSVTEKKEEK